MASTALGWPAAGWVGALNFISKRWLPVRLTAPPPSEPKLATKLSGLEPVPRFWSKPNSCFMPARLPLPSSPAVPQIHRSYTGLMLFFLNRRASVNRLEVLPMASE